MASKPPAPTSKSVAPEEQGFDRKEQGAPRSDDATDFAGQSGYGGLSAGRAGAPGEHQLADRRESSADQSGNYGEGSYGGAKGESERGGLSSYGTSSGSRYLIDNEMEANGRTAANALHTSDPPPSKDRFSQSQHHRPAVVSETPRNDDDVALHERISKALGAEPRIDVDSISIVVAGGSVVLQGSVPKRTMVQAIIACITAVPGVAKLDNQLTVKNEVSHATTFATGYAVGLAHPDESRHEQGPAPVAQSKPKAP